MTYRLELPKVIVPIFFAVFLGLGLFLVKDYGVCLDEYFQREIGRAAVNYIVEGDQTYKQFYNRVYGPFFEIILAVLEKGLHLPDDYRAIFLMRHYATFLMFYAGVFFFYKLCKKIFASWQAGLLGALFLILSPRIFADAFYNSKDIPCLSVFILCIYTLNNYLENKTFWNTFIHALSSAALIDIRITGIIIPFVTLLFTVFDIGMARSTASGQKMSKSQQKSINRQKDRGQQRIVVSIFVYCFFLIVFTILFWPYLWDSPLNNFIQALQVMAHYQWPGTILYFGQYMDVSQEPWHYVPVWMAISTPLAYGAFFCIGCLRILALAASHPVEFYKTSRSQGMVFLLFSLPVLVVIMIKSIVYDGWRQMYFVYPAFLVIAIYGLRYLFGSVKAKPWGAIVQTILVIVILCNLSCVVDFMVKNHPYQNVYFNSLAGPDMRSIKTKFEMDYWGLSLTRALQYIVRNDPDRHIKIYLDHRSAVDPNAWGVGTWLLPAGDRERLLFVDDIKEAKYFVSDYRWHKQEYPFHNELYSVKVEGVPIAAVYQL